MVKERKPPNSQCVYSTHVLYISSWVQIDDLFDHGEAPLCLFSQLHVKFSFPALNCDHTSWGSPLGQLGGIKPPSFIGSYLYR